MPDSIEKTGVCDMTHEQRQARGGAKRLTILRFLASGERWTVVEIAQKLFACERTAALATLQSLAADGLLRRVKISPTLPAIWGITSAGLAEVDDFTSPPFEGANPLFFEHHIATQRARLRAEDAGWTNWTPGKKLLPPPGKNKGGQAPKVPDAIVTDPSGRRIAIEIERLVKAKRKYREIIKAHLLAIKAGKYDAVHYISPTGKHGQIEAALLAVHDVELLGERVKLTDAHRARFKFFDLANWPTVQS